MTYKNLFKTKNLNLPVLDYNNIQCITTKLPVKVERLSFTKYTTSDAYQYCNVNQQRYKNPLIMTQCCSKTRSIYIDTNHARHTTIIYIYICISGLRFDDSWDSFRIETNKRMSSRAITNEREGTMRCWINKREKPEAQVNWMNKTCALTDHVHNLIPNTQQPTPVLYIYILKVILDDKKASSTIITHQHPLYPQSIIIPGS